MRLKLWYQSMSRQKAWSDYNKALRRILDSVKDPTNARIAFGRFTTLQFSEKAHNVFAPICFVWLPHVTGVHIIG